MDHGDNESPKREENANLAREDVTIINEDPARLARTEVRPGRFLGQERIRITQPSHASLRRTGTGMLKATEAAQVPRGLMGRTIYAVKRFFIGTPIATEQAEHERLTKFKALAVLSSDAIS
ncbi:MAG: hypothetical protein ACXVBU_11540, partial [Ktedonobacteraceae bacterium]